MQIAMHRKAQVRGAKMCMHIIVIETYSQRQWAAVNSHRSFNIDAPQKWPPRRVKLAINGTEPRSASIPPTMRPFRAVISRKFDSNPLRDIDESVRSMKYTNIFIFCSSRVIRMFPEFSKRLIQLRYLMPPIFRFFFFCSGRS